MAELTPAQRKQLEQVINSSVLTGSGDLRSGGYQMGVNQPVASTGTSLTSRSVPIYNVDEYGSPILAQAKQTGETIYNPDASAFGRLGPRGNRLPEEKPTVFGVAGIPGTENIPGEITPEQKMAAKYGTRLNSSNPTRQEDQLILSEVMARRNKDPKFVSGMQKRPGVDDGLVYADGVEDPWTPSLRGSKGRVDAKVAARAAPTFRGSSLGGGFLGSILSGFLGKGGTVAAAPSMGLSLGSSGGGGGSYAPVSSSNEQESKFQWTENTGLPKSVSSDPRWW